MLSVGVPPLKNNKVKNSPPDITKLRTVLAKILVEDEGFYTARFCYSRNTIRSKSSRFSILREPV